MTHSTACHRSFLFGLVVAVAVAPALATDFSSLTPAFQSLTDGNITSHDAGGSASNFSGGASTPFGPVTASDGGADFYVSPPTWTVPGGGSVWTYADSDGEHQDGGGIFDPSSGELILNYVFGLHNGLTGSTRPRSYGV